MNRITALLIPVLLALAAVPSAAADVAPRIVFPAGQVWPTSASGVITVEAALLQFELHPGQVLSAPRGTRLSLVKTDIGGDAVELNIVHGAMTWVDLGTNAISHLPAGSYTLAPIGLGPKPVESAIGRATPPREDAETLAPGYRLSDAIMTQQQKYLDTLKVDVRDINHALASFMRRLLFK